MIRMTLKVLFGLALSLTLTAILTRLGWGLGAAGNCGDSFTDQVALFSRR